MTYTRVFRINVSENLWPIQWPFNLVPASCSHICLNITSNTRLLYCLHDTQINYSPFHQRIFQCNIPNKQGKGGFRCGLPKKNPDLFSTSNFGCGIIWKNRWFSECCDFSLDQSKTSLLLHFLQNKVCGKDKAMIFTYSKRSSLHESTVYVFHIKRELKSMPGWGSQTNVNNQNDDWCDKKDEKTDSKVRLW